MHVLKGLGIDLLVHIAQRACLEAHYLLVLLCLDWLESVEQFQKASFHVVGNLNLSLLWDFCEAAMLLDLVRQGRSHRSSWHRVPSFDREQVVEAVSSCADIRKLVRRGIFGQNLLSTDFFKVLLEPVGHLFLLSELPTQLFC